jgi:outer membrane protein assembly factor BamB
MLKKLCLTLTFALLVCLDLSAQDITQSKDWPQWRGPRRDNISTETNLLREWPKEGPPLLWTSKTVSDKSIGVGYSSISIANGKIFTMGDLGKDGCFVFCLDEKSGKFLWSTKVSPQNTGSYEGPRCTPTVDGDLLYVTARQGILSCLNANTGELVWKKDFVKDFKGKMMSGWGYSESPLIDGDKVVCTPGGEDAALVALNKKTGEVIWKSAIPKNGGAGYASIVIAEVGGIRQYITLLGADKGLVGVNAANGKFLWNYNKAARGTANIPTALVKGDMVFTSTGYDAGAALLQLVPEGDGIKAKEVYYLPGNKLQNHHGGMVLIGDYIYGGHGNNNGKPFCLEMKTGKFAWGPVNGAGRGSAAVAYADGHLYFRHDDNEMSLIEATPDGYKVKSHFRLPEGLSTPGWQHPVILHGRMYIRANGELLCYDIRQK